MQYQDAVTEFRSLDESIEAGQWRQAQLTAEQLEHLTEREWAQAVGKGAAHIHKLKVVWRRWGASSAKQRPSFAEAYRMADTGTDTLEEASAIKDAGRAASSLSKLPARSRAAIIREHLADPDVAKEVLSDPDAVDDIVRAAPGRVGKAVTDHNERVREHVERGPNADLRESLQTRIEVLNVLQALGAVRVAVPKLENVGHIQPVEMEMLVDEAQQTLASVQWLAALTPDQADLSDEVAAFLASQS